MRVILVLAAALFAATSASAQFNVADANISLGYGFDDYGPGERTVFELEGDLTAAVSSSFDVQLNVGIFGVDDGPGSFGNTTEYFGIHGIYNFGTSRAGAFLEIASTVPNYGYYYYGLEYQYDAGPLLLEIQAGQFEAYANNLNYATHPFVNATIGYEYGDFNFSIGQYWSDDSYDQLGTLVHVGYDTSWGAELFAEYHAETRDSPFDSVINTIVLGVSMPFGAGTRTAFDSPASQILRRIGAP